MRAIAAVFTSREQARAAGKRLRAVLPGKSVYLMTDAPVQGSRGERGADPIPVTEDMSPVGDKMLAVLAACVLGVGVFYALGGPAGLPAALVLGLAAGAVGLVGGYWLGGRLDRADVTGIPVDELEVYRSAVRKGRSVVIAMVAAASNEDVVRDILESASPEALEPARHIGGEWHGDGEDAVYDPPAGDGDGPSRSESGDRVATREEGAARR